MKESGKILLLHEGLSGHRAQYIRLFSEIFRENKITIEHRGIRFSDIFRGESIFSTMMEEHGIRFAVVAAARSVFGRYSATLLFRPMEAVYGKSIRLKFKRIILAVLRRIRGISVFAIFPPLLDRRLELVTTDWIYDPQLWDLEKNTPTPHALFDFKALARGRKIVAAIGTQNSNKGFGVMCDAWVNNPSLRERYLFVSAGKVAENMMEEAAAFSLSGGYLINRFITDEELLSLYESSDLIWCCYSPEYDQASGIFGRAAQLGRCPIVRQGSQMEALATLLNLSVIAVPWKADQAATILLHANKLASPELDTDQLRLESMNKIFRALGLVDLVT